MKTLCGPLILALLLSTVTSASAATVTMGASRNNSLFQNAADNSAGGGAGIFAGATAVGSPRRGLIEFDVAGSLPPGAVVTGATLTLYLAIAGGGTSQPIGVHRLTADWGEGTAGDSLPTVMGSGLGFSAADGDATWNASFHSFTAWTNPGATGDFIATASVTALVADLTGSPYTWGSSLPMVSDVQSWYSNPSTNFGWALVAADEVTRGTARAFYSRHATVNSGGDPLDLAWRPALTVEYFILPEPHSALLLLAGLSLAIGIAAGGLRIPSPSRK